MSTKNKAKKVGELGVGAICTIGLTIIQLSNLICRQSQNYLKIKSKNSARLLNYLMPTRLEPLIYMN